MKEERLSQRIEIELPGTFHGREVNNILNQRAKGACGRIRNRPYGVMERPAPFRNTGGS